MKVFIGYFRGLGLRRISIFRFVLEKRHVIGTQKIIRLQVANMWNMGNI